MSVLVLDASAAVELLLRSAAGRRAAGALRRASVAAPAHFDAEVLSALGRLVRAGELEEGLVGPLLEELSRAPIARYPVSSLLAEAWELRRNVTLRDALYVVLARRLDGGLITADARLSRAPALGIAVTVV